MGGGCIDKRGQCESIIDLIVPGYLVVVTGLLLLDFMAVSHAILVLLLLLQMPFLYLVFGTSVKWMKKKKKSATTNKVVSYSLLVGASLVYMAVMMGIVLHSDWIYREGSPYRTVMWELTPTESHEYRLYSDTLPLTCEDLYGASDYDYYSYEKNRENSLFLTSTQYRQFALPAYDAPPSIEYTIIEPKFDFVYDIVEKELKTTRDWSERSIEPMDNIIFGTEQAYQTYYDKDAIGEYLLFYQDKIIVMNVEEPVTEEQRTILIEKLKLGSR